MRSIDSAIRTLSSFPLLSNAKAIRNLCNIGYLTAVLGSRWSSLTKLSSSLSSTSASEIHDNSSLHTRNFTEFYGKHEHCKYSSHVKRGGHIVDQYFEYIEKVEESKEVVKAMRYRQEARRENIEKGQPSDKRNNHLIAIPGNPGSGKSTFLAHFPESTAYREYAGDAIVSTLTFNGGMAGKSKGDCIGLRIIYGAFKGMGLLPKTYKWKIFVNEFGHELPVDDDEISTAVEVLRKVFGRDRRVLILVDELSKSKDPRDIYQKLGMILDKDGDVDVIVSSLSPAFIADLLSGSQRGIDYIILQNMLKYDLGKAECRVWADKVIKASRCDTLPEIKKNLLYNAYMLYSGHPRSLQNMCRDFANSELWNKFEEFAKDLDYAEPIVILQKYLISGGLLPVLEDLADMSAQDVRRLILSTSYSSVKDVSFRRFVEAGSLTIARRRLSEFQTSTQVITFYKLIQSGHLSPEFQADPCIAAAIYLLSDIKELSVLWERLVCLNIVCKLNDIGSKILPDALGFRKTENIPKKSLPIKEQIKIKMEETLIFDFNEKGTALILPLKPDNPGYDAMLRISDGSSYSFYLQMKLMKEKEHVHSMAWTIKKCIDDYQFRTKNLGLLSDLHTCVYIFDEDLETSVREERGGDSKACASEELRSHLEDSELALQFVNEHFGNFHVIGKDKLERWMNPTLLPLAQMIRNIRPGDDKDI